MRDRKPTLAILGCRGIPARYGGFETFAEKLALFLAAKDWEVTVYCQTSEPSDDQFWHGIRLVHIATGEDTPLATALFDFLSTIDCIRHRRFPLVLGYNTAVFSTLFRLIGQRSIMNMDGIEWRRDRWGPWMRLWFRINEWFGCHFSNHLVADHPRIEDHLAQTVRRSKITTIAYGAEPVITPDPAVPRELGLDPGQYALLVARMVPENSVLDVLKAWKNSGTDRTLAVVGPFWDVDPYCQQLRSEAVTDGRIRLLGGIYDKASLSALRYYARFSIHGHRVGGTNPSLVEALAAGSPLIAHDNPYNRWVIGEHGLYFTDADSLTPLIDRWGALPDPDIAAVGEASLARFHEAFQWDDILSAYEALLLAWIRR